MTTTIAVDEAKAKLKELIHQLVPGEEIITENSQPIAKLVGELPKEGKSRVPGLGRGSVI